MAQFPCLPLWTDAWIADTAHLSRLERGTYMDLLVLMWRTPGCRVPNDNEWIAKHLRLTVHEVEMEVRNIINEFCQTDGNWITQKRLKREFIRRFEHGAVQSVRAKSRKQNKTKVTQSMHAGDATFPSLPFPKKNLSSFSLPRVESSQVQQNKSARSLASAPDDGALTRSPSTEQDQPKQSDEMTLAEINKRWRSIG